MNRCWSGVDGETGGAMGAVGLPTGIGHGDPVAIIVAIVTEKQKKRLTFGFEKVLKYSPKTPQIKMQSGHSTMHMQVNPATTVSSTNINPF